jgi:hypothetical protein
MTGAVSAACHERFSGGLTARAVACAGLMIVAGCANRPCDPFQDQSIFKVAGCVVGGGYNERIARLQDQLAQAEADEADAEQMLARARSRRDNDLVEREQLRVRFAAQRAQAIRFQRELIQVGEASRVDQGRLRHLEDQAAALRDTLDAQRNHDPHGAPDDAVIQQHDRDLRELQQEWDLLRQVAPRN